MDWIPIFGQASKKDQERIVRGAIVLAGCAWFLTSRYHSALPHQRLIRTGLGIGKPQIGRNFISWPLQNITVANLVPSTFEFELQCLSKQYLSFILPVKYTIGPVTPEENGQVFERFCGRILPMSIEEKNATIMSIIHGETRVLTSDMDIDALNDNRSEFNEKVIQVIDKRLQEECGLCIVNANISEIKEPPRLDSQGYLASREKRKLSAAVADAQIDIAEAKKREEIETKRREVESRTQCAQLELVAIEAENRQKQAVTESSAQLLICQADAKRRTEMADVEALQMAEKRNQELLLQVQEARGQQELASWQASLVSKIKAESESKRVEADAALYVSRQAAEQIKMQGEAQATAALAKLTAEAQGRQQSLQADAHGLQLLIHAAGDNTQVVKDYLYIREGVTIKVAEEAAKALVNMKPQIFSITNPSETTSGGSVQSFVDSLFRQALPFIHILQQPQPPPSKTES